MDPDLPRDRRWDLVAAGELVADFISDETVEDLGDADRYRRFLGGSPANLARNLAVLGARPALVATVGDDGLGRALIEELEAAGVATGGIARHASKPTSSVLIGRSPETPDFIHYRRADRHLRREQFGDALLSDTAIFHTTCIGLSREPARSAMLEAADEAAEHGAHSSIDANYVADHWPDAETARRTLRAVCRRPTLLKISMDDIERLFGADEMTRQTALRRAHGWGASLVCLTMGSAGSYVSRDQGETVDFVEAASVDQVHGATGAGDAYWSGFLKGWIDGRPPVACAGLGADVAAKQVASPGPVDGS